MRVIKKILGLAALTLALGACGVVEPDQGVARPMASDDGLGTPAPAATSATTAPDPLLKKVGEIARWEDGASAAVASLKKYTPTGTAAGHQPGNVAFEVTVTLGTTSATPLDLTLASTKARAGAQGDQCEQVYDSGKGVNGMFEGTVSGGRSATVRVAFSCPAAAGLAQVSVLVQPTWNHNVATFEGGL